MEKIKDRKIVVINQASNYLTVGFCNAFSAQFESVSLITGSIHIQGEELNKNVKVTPINNVGCFFCSNNCNTSANCANSFK